MTYDEVVEKLGEKNYHKISHVDSESYLVKRYETWVTDEGNAPVIVEVWKNETAFTYKLTDL